MEKIPFEKMIIEFRKSHKETLAEPISLKTALIIANSGWSVEEFLEEYKNYLDKLLEACFSDI